MATYKKGINGPIKGKIGHVVAVTWRGIEVLRAMPEPSSKPASPAQLKQRRIFGMVNSWVKPLRDLIWIGYQLYEDEKTPMNHAVSFIMKQCLTAEGQIDFPKVAFSRGDLHAPMMREIIQYDDLLIHLKWENTLPALFNAIDDLATFIFYNSTKGKFVTFEAAAQRDDSEALLQLPTSFAGDLIHGYVHFVRAHGVGVSTSVYLGEIQIGSA